VHAINIGSFNLGEADKVLTLFTAEKGIVRAVAKGSRKPGTKMAGRADVLNINKLFLSTGKTFEIITQAETVDSFPALRGDLLRLSFGLYYAELSNQFGAGLNDESNIYYEYLRHALHLQAAQVADANWLSLEFEMGLLDLLGYRPEVTYCVLCREILTEYNIGCFNTELGGVLCQRCSQPEQLIKEGMEEVLRREGSAWKAGIHLTPLVWKNIVLAGDRRISTSHPEELSSLPSGPWSAAVQGRNASRLSVNAAHRLAQSYLEHRAGRRMKALDLLAEIKA
jgi:DNA repair protein RecO (recombination protein O)